MQAIGAWLLKTVLAWVLDGLREMAVAYFQRKQDEAANREVRENLEKATTEQEQQDALDGAGDRLGRRTP